MTSQTLALWRSVLFDKTFAILWIAMLFSTAGSFVFLLAVSVHAYETFESAFTVGAVFASQWALALAAPPLVAWMHARFPLPRGLGLLETAAALVTLGAVLIDKDESNIALMLILVVLIVRGMLDAITKSLRMIVLRRSFEGSALKLAASSFGTSYYLGGAIGGMLGAVIVTSYSIDEIILVNVATYVFAATIYQMLKKETAVERGVGQPSNTKGVLGAWKDAVNVLVAMPELRAAWLRLTLTVAAFQGFHNVARTVLPIDMFEHDGGDVAFLQGVASVAIFVGAVSVAILTLSNFNIKLGGTKLIAAAAVAMILPLLAPSWIDFLVLYFCFIFLFEVAFTIFQRDMVVACPVQHIAVISAASQSVMTIALAVTALIVGAMIDLLGAQVIAIGLAVTVTGLSILVGATSDNIIQNPRSTKEREE